MRHWSHLKSSQQTFQTLHITQNEETSGGANGGVGISRGVRWVSWVPLNTSLSFSSHFFCGWPICFWRISSQQSWFWLVSKSQHLLAQPLVNLHDRLLLSLFPAKIFCLAFSLDFLHQIITHRVPSSPQRPPFLPPPQKKTIWSLGHVSLRHWEKPKLVLKSIVVALENKYIHS